MWNVIKLILEYFYCRFFVSSRRVADHSNSNNNNNSSSDENAVTNGSYSNNQNRSKYHYNQRRCVSTVAAPGLMTLLDTALYRAHEGQLTATVSSANATLLALVHLKSHAKSLLHVCYTQLSPISLTGMMASSATGSGSSKNKDKNNSSNSNSYNHSNKIQLIQRRKRHLETVSILTAFALYCIECANDGIERFTTDKLSKSANFEPMSQLDYQKNHHHEPEPVPAAAAADNNAPPLSPTQPLPSPITTRATTAEATTSIKIASGSRSASAPSILTSNTSRENQNKRAYVEEGIVSSKYNHWNEVGVRLRYLQGQMNQRRKGKAGLNNYFSSSSKSPSSSSPSILRKKDCWESELLYCPDYVWAEDSMLQCQRMVRSIMKHDAIELMIDLLHSSSSTGINATSKSGNGAKNTNATSPTSNNNNSHNISINTGSNANSSSSGYANINSINTLLPLLYVNNDSSSTKVRNKLVLLISNIITLLKYDLPLRLYQFRCGMESDMNVTKRLYLLKNECRAPFRAFLEGHAHVQRAPDLSLVDNYIELHNREDDYNGNNTPSAAQDSNSNDLGHVSLKEKKKIAERKIQDCIGNSRFQEALITEYKCETLEVEIGMVLLPFCNLARTLFGGRGAFHLIEVPGVLPAEEVLLLQELLRRLKAILCKKPGVHTSTGIRPLLQDLQGIPRDSSPLSTEIFVFGRFNGKGSRLTTEEAMEKRLDKFCSQLQCIYDVTKTKGGFGVDKKEFDGLPAAIRACINAGLDTDKLRKMFKEWYSLCRKQQTLSSGNEQGSQEEQKEAKETLNNDGGKNNMVRMKDQSFEQLAEEMRKAEIEVSIAMASKQALSVVQQRIDQIERDRTSRFEILQEMLEEICLREMDFHLDLQIPRKDTILELPCINSVSGIFDPVLEMSGEI